MLVLSRTQRLFKAFHSSHLGIGWLVIIYTLINFGKNLGPSRFELFRRLNSLYASRIHQIIYHISGMTLYDTI